MTLLVGEHGWPGAVPQLASIAGEVHLGERPVGIGEGDGPIPSTSSAGWRSGHLGSLISFRSLVRIRVPLQFVHFGGPPPLGYPMPHAPSQRAKRNRGVALPFKHCWRCGGPVNRRYPVRFRRGALSGPNVLGCRSPLLRGCSTVECAGTEKSEKRVRLPSQNISAHQLVRSSIFLGWGNGNPAHCYCACRKTTCTFEPCS